MVRNNQAFQLPPGRATTEWPLLICLLGPFLLIGEGRSITVRAGGKIEALLSLLALRYEQGMTRDEIMSRLWPDTAAPLACSGLHSLVHSLHHLPGDGPNLPPPVIHSDGFYRLNAEAGVAVDVVLFDALIREGERDERQGNHQAAMEAYNAALDLYRGDLSAGDDVQCIVERERLRARYLSVLAALADHHYSRQEYAACLERALQLLAGDPCREDAHRLVMRCHVRRGERAQALRQYQLCRRILASEFDAQPEPATQELFGQARLSPASI